MVSLAAQGGRTVAAERVWSPPWIGRPHVARQLPRLEADDWDNPRNSRIIGYSFFNAGDYYDTTVGATAYDAQFFYMQYQTRF